MESVTPSRSLNFFGVINKDKEINKISQFEKIHSFFIYKNELVFQLNMSFRMSSDSTVTLDLGEGPGPSLGGIANFTNAEQTSERPSIKPGG